MVPLLRSRLALIGLLGAFLIPIGVSSLRGVTHVITCQEATNVPFAVSLPQGGAPTVSSAATFERGGDDTLCGGLRLNVRVGRLDADTLRVTLPIENGTKHTWQGTAKLDLGGTAVPVRLGKVRPGQTVERTVNFNVDPGVHEINGSLLIGP
ncbi:MAG: hypothetical protein H0W70_04635 [Actinobacteria bacterium]|nr:hypothetical protein [Actinomycetota bacterium]